ncbi:MAG: hypothetical protein LC792_09595 [Actinobacteria bacterium]|nr:hypothetical protein [Actinomycetota bacterium]
MGTMYQASCDDCHHTFEVNAGGGFMFHQLRCDTCGAEHGVPFEELGDLHGRWLKGLRGVYSIATAGLEAAWKEATPGEPLGDDEYHAAVEEHAGACQCGGHYRFDAPTRCPACRSSRLTTGMVVRHYD